MNNMGSPCLNCISRTLGCHGKCDKYNNFKLNRDKISQTRASSYIRSYNNTYDRWKIDRNNIISGNQ